MIFCNKIENKKKINNIKFFNNNKEKKYLLNY